LKQRYTLLQIQFIPYKRTHYPPDIARLLRRGRLKARRYIPV
jgi:hypothetical protein